jgi:fermentation-respiration switch protein FrsA (DUF1100 family)
MLTRRKLNRRLAKLFRLRGWTPYGLILQSPYISIHRIVSEYVKFAPWLIENHWDNLASVEKLGDMPILIIHGEQDEIVPVAHGRELYVSSKSKKKHLLCPSTATHNEWDLLHDVIKPIRDFISRYSLVN